MSSMSGLFTRRGWLKLGSLSLLTPSRLGAMGAEPAISPRRSCIFLMLQGGPSHLDLWDPKPAASREIRGQFGVLRTATPGMHVGELLPQTAQVSEHLAIIRSMTHKFTNHIAGTYITLTGSENQPDRDREAHSDDFPGPGAVLNYLQHDTPNVPRSVSLPNWLSIPGPSNRMPGQYAGWLGSSYDPFLIEGDPNQTPYNPLSLKLPDGFTAGRFGRRLDLLGQLDRIRDQLEQELNQRYDRLLLSAYRLVMDGRVREAVDLDRVPPAVRDRYGRTKLGQSLLLARRLVEAGVQFVGVNEFNQKWDTHGNLVNRYRSIVPPLDRAYAALVGDLHERGMLSSTLVVQAGEFGRTPRINNQAGRDHWPNAYSVVLAGGGVRGGTVYGQTDAHAGEVVRGRVSPADLLATMWHQLGIPPETVLRDRLNRPHTLSGGRVLSEILG